MAKRSTKKPTVSLNGEAVKGILGALLAEFVERKLDINDLRSPYKGLSPAELKALSCADSEVSEVDFDLAMEELSRGDLVKTGPMEMYPNKPGSSVMILMLFSKNEYSYLTAEGYKAATQIKAPRSQRSTPSHVHISGNTFQGSQIGIGGTVSQTADISIATTEQLFERTRTEIKQHIPDEEKQAVVLAKLDVLQAAPDKASKLDLYNQFVGSLSDHITVLGFTLPPLMHWLMR